MRCFSGGDRAVQEERGLVQQALGGFDALDHDAARHGVELRVLLGGELAASEDHHRYVGHDVLAGDLLQQVEAGDVGQAQVQHDAIDPALPQRLQRRGAAIDRDDVDVVMAQELGDAEALGGIVPRPPAACAAAAW